MKHDLVNPPDHMKQAIATEAEGVTRDLLLLAWSASVAKLNKTFLSSKGRAESRGGSSIFSIERSLRADWSSAGGLTTQKPISGASLKKPCREAPN